MKGTDVKCPACGMINKSLFLEETDGMYECERCGHTDTVNGYRRLPAELSKADTRPKGTGQLKRRLTPLMV